MFLTTKPDYANSAEDVAKLMICCISEFDFKDTVYAGFYPRTYVYCRLPQKIEIEFLYCWLNSVAPLGGPIYWKMNRSFFWNLCLQISVVCIFIGFFLEFHWEF